jgi:hypothetical protein
MTFQQLLGMSADQLDKLTDAELEVYFAPYLEITRPIKKIKLDQPKQMTARNLSKPGALDAFVAQVLARKGVDPKKVLGQKK